MPLTNLMVIYLQRKYGVPLHNFFEKSTSGISYLNDVFERFPVALYYHIKYYKYKKYVYIIFVIIHCLRSISGLLLDNNLQITRTYVKKTTYLDNVASGKSEWI